jgi:hypothetical protein
MWLCIPPQSRPKSSYGVAVFLNDANARFTYPDGGTEDITAKAGEVLHMEAFTQMPESTSKKGFELVQVELKG